MPRKRATSHVPADEESDSRTSRRHVATSISGEDQPSSNDPVQDTRSSTPRAPLSAVYRTIAPGVDVTSNLVNYSTGSELESRAPRPASGLEPNDSNAQFLHTAGSDIQLHPFNTLSRELAGFCSYAPDAYASCEKYCAKLPVLWQQASALPPVARQLLERGDETSARQAISRFIMLKASAQGTTTLGERLKYFGRLRDSVGARDLFETLCEEALKKLQNEQSRPSGTNESGLRRSSATGDARPNIDTLGPLSIQPGTRPRPSAPSETSNGLTNLDSVAGGVAMLGQSGPETAIAAQWPHRVRELLDKEFKVHYGPKAIDDVFSIGCLIAVFWHENLGHSVQRSAKYANVAQKPTSKNPGKGFISDGPKGEKIYSHKRRFVIVNKRQGHSVGIPVTSYSSKGVGAKTLSATEQRAHTIIYAWGRNPTAMQDEPEFTKDPICVNITAPNETLSEQSRLYYAKPTSIDHNIKAKYCGRVINQHIPGLLSDYHNEMLGTDE